VENGLAYITKGLTLGNLYVEAMSDYCNYEVAYMRMDFPLIIATLNRKYQFSQGQAGKMFMLYTHTSPQSFKIIQIINTGTLNVYASPVLNQSISQMLTADLQAFPFIDADMNGEFLVSNASGSFCWNCQYLIVLEAQTVVSS
jgi:hypothetical protein